MRGHPQLSVHFDGRGMALEHSEHHLCLQAILLLWSQQGIIGEGHPELSLEIPISSQGTILDHFEGHNGTGYLLGAFPSLVYILS